MTTRKILIAAVSAAAMSALASAACAAGSVSATAPASVTILSPATLTKTQDLVFGQIVRPSNANTNTVVLDANNLVTLTGSGNGSIVASTTRSAKFNVAAAAGVTYSTTQTLSFTQTGLTNVAPSLPTTTSGSPGVIPTGGIQEIRYGAQFDMNASTPAQTYNGTLNVTVNYN